MSMMHQTRAPGHPAKPLMSAFTRLGLIVVVVVLLILGLLLWGSFARARAKAQRAHCARHLRTIGWAFGDFATHHGDRFPMGFTANHIQATNWAEEASHCFRALSDLLVSPEFLVCPADNRKPATNFSSLTIQNVSYFLGLDADEGRPQMFLAGDRNLTTNGVPVGPGLLEITSQSALGWTKAMHKGIGNLVLSDGSVQQVTAPRLRDLLTNVPGSHRLAAPQRLAVP